jgi:hypothetical protein
MHSSTRLVFLGLAVSLAACSRAKEPSARETMTKRQRDSVFAASGFPNAAAVGKAMTAADSLEAQRKRADSAIADTTKPPAEE